MDISTNFMLIIVSLFTEKTWYLIMLRIIKKIFIGLLTRLVNASDHTKCVSLIYILMNFTKEFYYYPYAVK